MISPLTTPETFPHRALPALKTQPNPPVIRPRFGEKTDRVSLDRSSRLIDDDVYRVIWDAEKFESHMHQSGSSDIGFLKYAVMRAIQNGDIDELEWINPDTGEVEKIPVGNITEEQAWKLLDEANVRRHYRVALQNERKKYFAPDETIQDAEDESNPRPSLIDIEKKLREEALTYYLSTSRKINPRVKNTPAAYLLARMLPWQLNLENVRYAEYRVSPSADRYQDTFFTPESLIHWVDEGLSETRAQLAKGRRDFDYGLIILFERNSDPKKAVELARETIRLKERYNIVGVDLAGGELQSPVTDFAEAFQVIRDYNENPATLPEDRLGITIHAGETPRSGLLKGWESIDKAIDIGWSPNTPFRIGHGTQIVNSSDTLKKAFDAFMKNPGGWGRDITEEERQEIINSSPVLRKVIDRGIVVEMCPKSNVQTFAVPYHTHHPAVFLSRLGVKVSISTDNRTISNSTMPNEFVKLYKHAGLTYDDFKRMVTESYDGAFIHDPLKKKRMIDGVKARFEAMETDLTRETDENGKVSYPYIEGIYKMNHDGRAPDALTRFVLVQRARIIKLGQMLQQLVEEARSFLQTIDFTTLKSALSLGR